MTALIVIAIIVGAVVAFSAIAEAIRRLRKAARPEADLEAIADATREPPQFTDEQIERLREALRKAREAPVVAHCPDCGEQLQDEAFEFWCPNCEAAVSYARVAAEGA